MLTKEQLQRAKRQVTNQFRRAKNLRVENVFNINEWVTILEASHGVCCRCGLVVGIERLEPDHIIPLARGGSNVVSNIQAMCKPCNRSKCDSCADLKVRFVVKLPSSGWAPYSPNAPYDRIYHHYIDPGFRVVVRAKLFNFSCRYFECWVEYYEHGRWPIAYYLHEEEIVLIQPDRYEVIQ